MPEFPPILVSTLPPSATQRRAALATGIALLVVFLAALPVAQAPLPRIGVVIPVVSTIMFLGDCISAVLLFGQFAVLRSRALLVLAGGYLFTGFVVVPYALTFPGALTETGLLGANLQTAAWIFLFWHLGLPVTVSAYALLRDSPAPLRAVQATIPAAILGTVAIAALLAVAVTWFAIHYTESLPSMAVDATRLAQERFTLAGTVVVSIAGFIVLARRQRSVLDLWLLVVLFAWLLDSVLTYLTESRFTGAWYANRVIRIVSANVVLFVLLAESTRLYARLATSIQAQRREREGRALSMEAMSAAIEHEIRQPLGAIAANASAAKLYIERAPPHVIEAREALQDVLVDAERASATLRAVRELFAPRDRDREPLDPNQVVREAIELARVELESLAIGVQLQLAAGLPPIQGNRRQLQEVILNLANNAAEAMHDVSDHVAVLSVASSAIDRERIEIAVADTGTGLQPGDAERIFEPFYTTKKHGMGMGLAICRSIVERHGGSLSAAPGTPYGAVFRVVLPCR